jgi:hypothetical protein
LITRRTLLIYNFGIALIFLAIGLLSLFTLDPFANRSAIQPPFDPASLAAIQEEEDVDRLRTRASYYFELGRDLKRARYADTDTLFRDFRFMCFVVGIAFALGGLMSMLAVTNSAASPPQSPRAPAPAENAILAGEVHKTP